MEAAIFFYRPTWPAASKTNASWPAHQLGRAGEVIHRREEKTGTRTVTFCLLPKGTCPRPQPAQPVGGPLPAFNERAAGQVPERSTASPTQPHQKGVPGEEPLPRGSFPISSQEMGPRLGKPPFPAVPTAWAIPQPPRRTSHPYFQVIHLANLLCHCEKIYALSNFFLSVFALYNLSQREKEMERFR